MIRARIKKWLRSFGAEHPDAMRSRVEQKPALPASTQAELAEHGRLRARAIDRVFPYFNTSARLGAEALKLECAGQLASDAAYRALTSEELGVKNEELLANGQCPRRWQITAVPAAVEVPAALVPVCTCQADNTGAYAGMQPLGGRLMMVGFRCQHGAVWGEEMTKEEAQKFHPKEEPVSEKPAEKKTESLFTVHRLNEVGMTKAKRLQDVFEKALEYIEEICGSAPSREMSIVRTKLEEAAFFAKKAMAVKPENQE